MDNSIASFFVDSLEKIIRDICRNIILDKLDKTLYNERKFSNGESRYWFWIKA